MANRELWWSEVINFCSLSIGDIVSDRPSGAPRRVVLVSPTGDEFVSMSRDNHYTVHTGPVSVWRAWVGDRPASGWGDVGLA